MAPLNKEDLLPEINLRDGSRMRYLKIGRGQPVVLLHGFGLNASHWQPFIARYINKYCFVIPDFRGHGKSFLAPFTRPNYPFQELCEDLDELVEHLGIDKFGMVGFSMGAVVGLHYILYYAKGRVDRYMHIEAGPKFLSDENWDMGFNPLAVNQARNLMEEFSHEFDPHETLERLPSKFIQCYRDFVWNLALISWPPGTLSKLLRKIPHFLCQPWLPHWHIGCTIFDYLLKEGYDLCSDMNQIKIPVTLVGAEKTEFFPVNSIHWMNDHIDKTKLVLFNKSGHGLMYSEPIKFVSSLGSFLNQSADSQA
ncbi:MAG: hypothetical protein CMP10_19900 [Zetaproteobacteria bacterium]|nr:hypothetical protein [Pseudobdellovibrionaceae bacterium]